MAAKCIIRWNFTLNLRKTDQIAFLPSLLVMEFIERRAIREIRCSEVPIVEKELYLSVRSDVVPQAVYNALADAMTTAI